jgi:hypothetical protein
VIDEEVYRVDSPITDSGFISLIQSIHKSERMSGLLNTYLAAFLRDHSYSSDQPLLVFHHHYIADTQFPGLKNRFTFRDIALSPVFLDNNTIRLISGHIHQPFGI